jgi:hypothetical protein
VVVAVTDTTAKAPEYIFSPPTVPTMPMYDRTQVDSVTVVGDFGDVVSWVAHPDEEGVRASHAIRTEHGVWVIDPIDGPNVDDILDSLGDVIGVAVLSCYHARDAERIANRHDVAVHVPEWMDRVPDIVDAPVNRYALRPDEGYDTPTLDVIPCRPFPGWQEAFLYHDASKTLVTPDSLGTTEIHCLDDEPLGLSVFRRLQPPSVLAGLEPERILPGHGEPLTEDATTALRAALDGARASFPTAVTSNGVDSMRAGLGAVLD